jgi:hypothetical protein
MKMPAVHLIGVDLHTWIPSLFMFEELVFWFIPLSNTIGVLRCFSSSIRVLLGVCALIPRLFLDGASFAKRCGVSFR